MRTPEVNKNKSMPIYEQVAAEIRRAIADGEAKPGERLPPAIDLAEVLGVNKNTVIRALHILRDEGLLDFTRCAGQNQFSVRSRALCGRENGCRVTK